MSPTAEQYAAAFAAERAREYPDVDALEVRTGFAVDRRRLEAAARVLACPVKANPPCWQHGRVVYSVLSAYLAGRDGPPVRALDVGTAKGFSALCARWAIDDARARGTVTSVDVIDPAARVSRNTAAEVDGLLTLAETLSPWPEAANVEFLRATGVMWLTLNRGRVNFAFVDGKHAHGVVLDELALLSAAQVPGDVVVADDVQIPGVRRAVDETDGYDVEIISVLPTRSYAIMRKTP